MDLHQEFQSSRFFHNARIDRRSAESLIGIATGLVADGTINQQEAEFLKGWIETHLAHLGDPVINILYRRLGNMLSDGILQADEASELLDLLHQLTGGPATLQRGYTAPTTLPLDIPPPALDWTGRVFVFTGVSTFYNPMEFNHLTSHDVRLGMRFLLGGYDYAPPPPLRSKG